MNKILVSLIFLSSLASAGSYTTHYTIYKPAMGDTDYVIPFATGMDNIDTVIWDLNTSTTSIYAQLQSTSSALTDEIARATAREDTIGVSTGNIYSALNSTATSLSNHISLAGTAHGGIIPSSATGIYPLSISGTATEAIHASTASNVTTNADLKIGRAHV